MSAPNNPEPIVPAFRNEAPFLAELFRDREIYTGFDAVDLRETAKFTEIPNALGLPIHPITRPAADRVHEFEGRIEDLPGAGGAPGGLAALREALGPGPVIVVRGEVASGLTRPFRVLGVFPQSHAELAHAFYEIITPDTRKGEALAEADPADFHLILWPDLEECVTLLVSESRVTLALGTDDIRAGLPPLIECANRFWTARTIELEARREAARAEGRRPTDIPEDIRLLPGGSFALEPGDLVYSGEALPEDWAPKLIAAVPALAARSATEIVLAGAEPWVAEGGGVVAPMWRNPPLPARLASLPPGWSDAAAHPDALPFGVPVDERARVMFEAADDEAFVVIHRPALAEPFRRSPAPAKATALYTHHYVREDAMELWARGFPYPKTI